MRKVCITDASGYVGSYVVQELLHRGCHVNAAVERHVEEHETNEETNRDIEKLLQLHDASDKLELFNFDIMDMDVLEDMVRGCDTLIHCASPLDMSILSQEDELFNTSMEAVDKSRQMSSRNVETQVIHPVHVGICNLLRVCEQTTSLRKVVFLSCFTAAMYRNRYPEECFTLTENNWSDIKFLKERDKWYHIGRLTAERTAWDFMSKGDRSFALCSVIPGAILGPMLGDHVPYSVSWLASFINGDQELLPNRRMPFTDVRDVARSCVLLAEKVQHSKRYPCAAHVLPVQVLCNVIRQCYDEAKCPTEIVKEDEEIGYLDTVESKDLEQMGMKFVDLKTTIQDTVEKLNMLGKLETSSTEYTV